MSPDLKVAEELAYQRLAFAEHVSPGPEGVAEIMVAYVLGAHRCARVWIASQSHRMPAAASPQTRLSCRPGISSEAMRASRSTGLTGGAFVPHAP